MTGISPIAVAVIAALAAVAVALGVSRRRRHARRGAPLSSGLDPLPAGLKHLASSVSDTSDVGIRLRSPHRALASRHRLGVLLGLR